MNKTITIIAFTVLAYTGSFAQCYPDRHNTSWFDGWISCAAKPNPNPVRGESHWIMYEMNHVYQLGQMHIWNTNVPDYLNYGIENAVIDVSYDGVNWTEVGQFTFQQADGTSTYEGFEGPDLEGYEGRYLLITGLSNYGGFCYGLSEIRVDVLGITGTSNEVAKDDCLSVDVFPNPIASFSKAHIYANCSSNEIQYFIQDLTGRTLLSGTKRLSNNEAILDLNLQELVSGSYILNLEQNGKVIRTNLIKIN